MAKARRWLWRILGGLIGAVLGIVSAFVLWGSFYRPKPAQGDWVVAVGNLAFFAAYIVPTVALAGLVGAILGAVFAIARDRPPREGPPPSP